MARTATAPGVPTTALGKAALEVDDRLIVAGPLRRTLNKVFPDHWSFLLGEIALYAFVILLLSGTYLTFFYDASLREVVYEGTYAPLRGLEMSAAYDSALNLSFDVRGGLFMRQVHHWAALLFVAAIVVHLLRIFFTGAFRRPRETNWLIGVGLLLLALGEGFTGYSLPDDLLSGTGLRIASAIILSIPVVGTWAHWAVFNGDYVGEYIIGRFYIAHVLIIPAVLLGLIAVHLLILVKQKHTQFPRPGADRAQRGRQPALPGLRRQGGRLVLHRLRRHRGARRPGADQPGVAVGPVQPGPGLGRVQPDWYIMFLDGSTRLFPAWDINLPGDYTIPALFWPTVVIAGLIFTVLALYPMIERKLTRDTASHHLPPASPRRPGADLAGRHGADLLHRAHALGRQRRHRRAVRHQPQRDDLGRTDRRADPAADRLRAHLPDLPRSAEARP
jgi:Cytochrome b subunit of the bc complex